MMLSPHLFVQESDFIALTFFKETTSEAYLGVQKSNRET